MTHLPWNTGHKEPLLLRWINLNPNLNPNMNLNLNPNMNPDMNPNLNPKIHYKLWDEITHPTLNLNCETNEV